MIVANIDNPYLDACNSIGFDRFDRFGPGFKLSNMDNILDCAVGKGGKYENYRDDLVDKYSWAIPNDEAIDEIIKYSPIIEIGAGTGYWASLISKAGADIVAFDICPVNSGKRNYWHSTKQSHFDVQIGSFDVLSEYINHTLLLCWPHSQSKLVSKCLDVYKGNTLLYVGESDGCTDWDTRLDNEWHIVKTIKIPQWCDIHDCLMIFNKKGKLYDR